MATKASKTTKKEVSSDKDLAKERRKKEIAKEIKRLSSQFKNIEPEKMATVRSTIEDAAFLTVSMRELRDQIAEEGYESEYKNGENQYGTKQSPAVLAYLQMSQKLNAAVKTLLSCQPKTEAKETDDRFDAFVEERGGD